MKYRLSEENVGVFGNRRVWLWGLALIRVPDNQAFGFQLWVLSFWGFILSTLAVRSS